MSLRVAIVGISYQENRRIASLENARSDSLKVLQAFSLHRPEDSEFFAALEPEQTSASHLVRGLTRFFSAANPGDDLVFVFEGHGTLRDGQSVIVGSDYAGNEAELVAVDDIVELMLKRQPRNGVVIVDACHSGEVKLPQPFYTPSRAHSAISVLSACDFAESALDIDELGGGLFTYMLLRALAGAAGQWEAELRKATVSSVFGFVARQVPAWIEANRQRLRLDGCSMTPRCVSDLRGDPILTLVPVARSGLAHQRDSRLSKLRHNLNPELKNCLRQLEDAVKIQARYAIEKIGFDSLFLEPETHHHELEMLLGRCAADLGGAFDLLEVFVLLAAIRTHDVGLGGAQGRTDERRFIRSAELVRAGVARGLVIPMPDAVAADAVAATLESMGRRAGECRGSLYWRGSEIRIDLLANMLTSMHSLSVMGERHGEEVGGGECGRLWVKRPLLSSIGDWGATGAAIASRVSGLNDLEEMAVQRWHVFATGSRQCLPTAAMTWWGPQWLDLE